METAQRLYEGVYLGGETAGLITYPRTDGTAMATTAVAAARAVVRARFGDDYLPAKPRTYRPRARRADTPRHATEAHEAIRPTGFTRSPEDVEGRLDRASARLYGLVWRRALASQMATARVDRVRIGLAPAAGSTGGDVLLAAEGADLAFDGHRRAWRGDDEGDEREDGAGGALPGLAEGEAVTVTAARAVRHVTGPPPRYTEAGLVRRLEELGIGRPSTWAAIVAVLQQRDYAILHDRRFVPTERGRIATAFLEAFFGRWVEYGFTAAMEADLDRVAGGSLAWRGMLAEFWGGFHAALEEAGGLERATVLAAVEARLDGFLFGAAPVSADPVSPDRRRCPVCGSGELELRLGRYGPLHRLRRLPGLRLPPPARRRHGGGGRLYRAARPRGGSRHRPRGHAQARPQRLVRAAGRGRRRRKAGTDVAAGGDGARDGRPRPRPAPAGAAPGGRAASGDRRADPGRHRPLRTLAPARRDLSRDPGGTTTC